MPTKGTPQSNFRLDPITKARLAEIRDYYGLPSDAAAVRHAVARLAITMGAAQAADLTAEQAPTLETAKAPRSAPRSRKSRP